MNYLLASIPLILSVITMLIYCSKTEKEPDGSITLTYQNRLTGKTVVIQKIDGEWKKIIDTKRNNWF